MADDDALLAALRPLLAAHVDDVPGLVSGARREAEARVHALLVQGFTDVLLEQARRHLATPAQQRARPSAPPPPPTGPAPAPARAPARDTTALGWYVYCIVGGDHAPVPDELTGIDSHHHITAFEHAGLVAVVSPVPLADYGEEPLREHLSDMNWLERAARRHEGVLEEIARGGTTIPMRLFSIYRDEHGLREMLERERDGLRRALAHLAGKTEWGVKAFADVDATEPPAPQESVLGPGDGAAYMQNRLTQRRRREDAERVLDEACRSIHATLGAAAVDSVTSAPQRPEVSGHDLPMVLNGSYLVADDAVEEFHAEVARLGDEFTSAGISLELTGPWPPYNFVPGAIGAGW
ncbi:MAG TPA: GvpL/GvpF family gas vesicle protein [Solirubrobacteraceae bacterium]|nr:GvpL/GvpF family gas vesicle protein [Solirubrobacteraceae bacterium]